MQVLAHQSCKTIQKQFIPRSCWYKLFTYIIIRTLGEEWPLSRGNVGRFSLYGASGYLGWFGCSVRSVNEWDLNLTWCWCQVLDLAKRSWELVFAPTMPPTRLLWKLWCRRPAYRWAWVEVVLENAFFLAQLLLRKSHMICIGFWKPFTIRVECKSWVSKHLETIHVFVSNEGKFSLQLDVG